MTPGTLQVRIDARAMAVEVIGGGVHTVPVGPLTLLDGPLRDSDPPPPAALTNALGLVQDHLDDLLIESPSIAATPGVVVTGSFALSMARVEIGSDEVPVDYVLTRSDADEVFRTLAVEAVDDRRHNPGLAEGHVESIIATCCVILGIMRRLKLSDVTIDASTEPSAGGTTTR